MKRLDRDANQAKGRGHFLAPSSGLQFVRTGCTGLDLVLGGGYVLGRITNIVGDKSTGKTLLAIEACSNFIRQYPNGKIWYAEAESAFDKSYAAALGMPVDRIEFIEPDTVEDFQTDLSKKANKYIDKDVPGLYILDSLDALSDRRELERAIDQNTYGGDKAKQMSQLFRKLKRSVMRANIAVVIISQVRDKIGISFGKKTTRSGGKALDFYASQVLYLSHLKTLVKTKGGEKRAVGVLIRAKCEKNKIGLPFREFEFPIRFAYGVEDLQANVVYLNSRKKLKELNIEPAQVKKILAGSTDGLSDRDYYKFSKLAKKHMKRAWRETETSFLPARSKYGPLEEGE